MVTADPKITWSFHRPKGQIKQTSAEAESDCGEGGYQRRSWETHAGFSQTSPNKRWTPLGSDCLKICFMLRKLWGFPACLPCPHFNTGAGSLLSSGIRFWFLRRCSGALMSVRCPSGEKYKPDSLPNVNYGYVHVHSTSPSKMVDGTLHWEFL